MSEHVIQYRRSGLKGAVLFTVLAVMMVMLILILTTISLAGIASKKAYSDWYDNQSNYTAQSLVDEIIVSLQPGQVNDEVGGEIVSKLNAVGQSVQLDVQSNGTSYIPGYGDIDSLTFTYVANEGTDYDVPGYKVSATNGKKIIKVTAAVKIGNEMSSYSRYVIGGGKNNRIDANGGGYNAISSNIGGAGSDTSPSVFGHYYAGIDGSVQNDATLGNRASLAGDIFYQLGNGKKLIIAESGPEMVFGRNDPAENFFSGLMVNGNIEFAGGKRIVSQYTNEIGAAEIFLSGSGGTVTLNDKLSMDNLSNIPYICSSGHIEMSSGILTVEGPLNIYCSYINLGGTGGGAKIDGNANIFCTDSTKTSNITNDSSTLTEWASATITDVQYDDMQTGNFYTKGDLNIDANGVFTIKGDLCVMGNLTIGKGTLEVTGGVYVGGTINDDTKITSSKVIEKDLGTSFKSTMNKYPVLSSCNVYYTDFPYADVKSGTAVLDNTKKANLYYLGTAFDDAFKEKRQMVRADGTITSDEVPVFQTLENLRNKYYDNLTVDPDNKVVAPSKYKSGGIDYSTVVCPDWDGTLPITSSCTIKNDDLSKLNATTAINPGGADICIILADDVKKIEGIKFVVDDSSGGSAAFYIKSTNNISFQMVKIITKTYDDLLLSPPEKKLNLSSLSSYPLNSTDEEYVPHVYLYADDGNPVHITFEHGDCLLTGDVLAPSAEFSWLTNDYKIAGTLDYTFFNYADVTHDGKVDAADKQLDKVTKTLTGNISVIGSIEVAKMTDVTNDFVYLYVDDPPFDGSGDLTEKKYTWNILDGYCNY